MIQRIVTSRRDRSQRLPLTALAAVAALLGAALAVVPAPPAGAAVSIVTTAQEFDDAVARLQNGDTIEVSGDIVAGPVTSTVPFTISVGAGSSLTVSAWATVDLIKTGIGDLRVTGALTASRDVAVVAGGLVADSLSGARLDVAAGALLTAGSVTMLHDVTVAGMMRTHVLSLDPTASLTISGEVDAERIARSPGVSFVSGLLETGEMTLDLGATMTVAGELRLTGSFRNEGVIINRSDISGQATVVNNGTIRGTGRMSMIESVAGNNYRLELGSPGQTEFVRVLGPTLSDVAQLLPLPDGPDGAVFRAWTVAGVPITGGTALSSLGAPVDCSAQPTSGCGSRIVATATWDALAFSAPPQVGVPTTVTFTGAETPTIAVDGAVRPGVTLTPAAADAGLPVRAEVRVALPSGYASSQATGVLSTTVALGRLAPATVKIVGDARVGQEVRVDVSAFRPAPDRVEFEWRTPLGSLGTGDRITVPASALNRPLTVTATAVAAGYLDEAVTSDAVLVAAAPTIPAAPAIPAEPVGALAATGSQPVLPALAAASALLLVGLVLMLARRASARQESIPRSAPPSHCS